MSSTNPTSDPTETYVIQITGELGDHWHAWFEGMSFEQPGDGTTVITGRVADQSALHGVLQRIRDLGMPIVSVTRRPSTDDPNQKGNQS